MFKYDSITLYENLYSVFILYMLTNASVSLRKKLKLTKQVAQWLLDGQERH